MSFFDRLRKGVQHIENEVTKLKKITEEGEQLSEEQMVDNLMKAKKFESEVRQTYVEVSRLDNEMKGSGDPLMASKTRIQDLRRMLCDIEDNSGIREFGYKPFTEHYSVDSMSKVVVPNEDQDFEIQNEFEEPLDERTNYRHPKEDYRQNDNSKEVYGRTNGHSRKENHNSRQSPEELNRKFDYNGEKTSETVRFAPDIPETSKTNGLYTYGAKNEEKSDEKITKKYDKLLTRTPQMQDFGITRRFTILPPVYNQLEANPRSQQYSTPEEPNFSSSQTCRFNYMNNGFNVASNLGPITPPNPNMSHNNSQVTDSFVTVEFTPGLTTKRPKGVSRINNDYNRTKSDRKNVHFNDKRDNKRENYNHQNQNYQNRPTEWSEQTQSQRLPQSILQNVDNNSEVTPEQPIPSADAAKSANLLKSIGGKGSGTPPMPKSRVDHNFHKQILKNL